MRQTWIVDAKERPSFNQILPHLERLKGRAELHSIDPLARVRLFNLKLKVKKKETHKHKKERNDSI